MRMVLILLTFLLSSPMAVRADDTAAIAKLIEAINEGMQTNPSRMMTILVINTDVAAETLKAEKRRTGLSYGEVYVAHSLAMASRRSFKEIVAMKAAGRSWSSIAKTLGVSLRGSTAALKEMLTD